MKPLASTDRGSVSTTSSGHSRMKRLLIFDVDGTLSLSQRPVYRDFQDLFNKLHTLGCMIAIVSGSDEGKIAPQFGVENCREIMRDFHVDFCCFENSAVTFKAIRPSNHTPCTSDTSTPTMSPIMSREGKVEDLDCIKVREQTFLDAIGDDAYQRLVNFVLKLLSEVELPKKRSRMIDLRTGLLNVSPIGRKCTIQEREEFAAYDAKTGIRKRLRTQILERFGEELDLDASLGGQISLDIFLRNQTKASIFEVIDATTFDEVHFFGDRCVPEGNDYPLFISDRVTHRNHVRGPEDTRDRLLSLINDILQQSQH